MNKFLFLGGVAVVALSFTPAAQAETALIFNQDTGAKVQLNDNERVIGTRNSAPEDNGYVNAENTANGTSPATGALDAAGGVLVKSDNNVAVGLEGDTTTRADAEVRHEEHTDMESETDVHGDVEADIDADSEEEANAKTEVETRIEVNTEVEADTNVDEEARAGTEEKRQELEAELNSTVEATQDEAKSRIQDLDSNADAGVDATATTTIDMK